MDSDKKSGDQEEGTWQYKTEGAPMPAQSPDSMEGVSENRPQPSEAIEWSASEFIAHEKSFGWYALLAVGSLVVAAFLYLVTKDALSIAVVLVMAIALGVSASRKPRVVTYRIDASGLHVGNKFYPYSAYKSFTVPEDGPFASVVLIPLKRFSFPVSAYLAPDSQDSALNLLADHLPMEYGEPDGLEHLMRWLRF